MIHASRVKASAVNELATLTYPVDPLKVTAVAPARPVPVIVTGVPPAVVPLAGLTDVTAGAGTGLILIQLSAIIPGLLPTLGLIGVITAVPALPMRNETAALS